jgi:hypothetical protein
MLCVLGKRQISQIGGPRVRRFTFHVQYEQGIIDEPAMKAYARLSVDLIKSNKVIQEHWKDSLGYSPSDVTRRSVAVHRRLSHILIDDLGAINLTEHLTAVTEDYANIDVSLDQDVALDDRSAAHLPTILGGYR